MTLSWISLLLSVALGASTVRTGYRAGEVTDRRVATALAMTCSSETFAAWTKSPGFNWHSNTTALPIRVTGASAEVFVGSHVVVVSREANGSLRASSGGVSIVGRDGCDLMTKLPRTRSVGSLFLPRAFAADVVHEERSDDYWSLGAGAGFLALGIVFPPSGLLSAAFFLWNAYDLMHTSLSLATKRSYEDMLNSDLSVECSDSATVLKSAAGRIVVKKPFTKIGRLVTIDLFGAGSDSPFEGASSLAPASAELLRKIAADCDSSDDAARWTMHLKAARLEMLAKVERGSGAAGAGVVGGGVVK